KDEFTINDINGDISVDVINDSTEYDTESYLECVKEDENVGKVWNYDYTGGEQTFTVPTTGTYKLETWGAAGGGAQAGFGGYSTGNVTLSTNEKIFVIVGGAGSISTNGNNGAGYNGGGNGSSIDQNGSGGGGATHIAKTSRGLLSGYSSYISELLIVSGGGGGSTITANDKNGVGGSGGGYLGVTGGYLKQLNWSFYGTGGSQTAGGICYLYDTNLADSGSFGTFGQGGNHGYESSQNVGGSGGGGGLYGGGGSSRGHGQAGGGSGYIGNSLLTEKTMYCYNCQESSEISTKTISTTCASATPTANCAKSGNGYVRISLISAPETITTDKVTISAQESTSQNLQNVTRKSLTCKLKVNKISRTEKVYTGPTEWNYDYTGGEQTFTVPTTGTYKLETWGAQGYSVNSTYFGGYGGYSVGFVQLKNNTNLYIYVGQNGPGGYGNFTSYPNGGASYGASPVQGGSGGGSTHILLTESNLSALKNNLDEILIVSGGGGASTYYTGWNGTGGHAGGYMGGTGTRLTIDAGKYTAGTGGSQTSGGSTGSCGGENGSFGKGGSTSTWGGSGGGGFYGGGGNCGATGGGGSGYIGNSLLTEKAMYCYNCQESKDISTKTISTTCTSATPKENCSKQGNGYARITLVNVS
ncbi:hypothetical protein EGP95_04060, partial [bacterium]|nr:hypothetical protein [bacterium]